MVVWMLQQRLLIQLHTYVFLVPTLKYEQNGSRKVRWIFGDSSPDSRSLEAIEQQDVTEDDINPELEEDLKGLTNAALDSEDLKLFTRLTPYFRGNHHLEEVMYYENLRRSQLLTLLDKFRDVLFSCQHEDPVTLYFYSS